MNLGDKVTPFVLTNKYTEILFVVVEENELFDFRGLRLDWYRLQAYTSVAKAGLMIRDHRDLARHMNTIIFHTKMVDYLDEILVESSDLSIYWLVNVKCISTKLGWKYIEIILY